MSKKVLTKSALAPSLIWLILILAVSSLFPHLENDYEHAFFTIITVLSYVFCIINWSKNCRFISLYVFFVFYCAFSNVGQSILYVFQVPQKFLSCYYFHSLSEINLMLRFQAACIAALNLGTCFFVCNPQKCVNLPDQQDWYKSTIQPGYKAPTILMVLFYISIAITVITMGRMVVMKSTMSYSDFFEAGRGQGEGLLNTVYLYFLLICVIYFTLRYNRKYLVFAVVGGMVVVQLLTGARGLSIPYLSALMVVLPVVEARLFKRRYLIFWVVGVVLFFSSIGLLSSIRTETLSTSNVSYKGSIGTNIIETISEMGYTERSSTLTIRAIDYGQIEKHQTILITVIKALIPFTSRLTWVSNQYIPLSSWVSEYGGSYHSGLGYSCIAEAYMNYGKVGWIFFLIYGYFISYAENTAYRRMMDGKYLYALILLLFLCNMIIFARGLFSYCQEIIRCAEYCFIGWILLNGIRK